MPRAALGRSTAHVTRLAFGAACLGNLYEAVSDEQAAATVQAAWEEGLRTFDVAPHYGLGLAERRLGAALRGRPRDDFTVSTKVGRLLEPVSGAQGDDMAHGFAVPADRRRVWDFSADGVRRSLEASLRRLGLDRVDIVYLHDPDDHEREALDQAYPALERLRGEGVVKAIGVGMNTSAMPARFVRDTDIDVVLLAGRYTLLDRSGLADLLPAARERGTSVVAGGVFNSGVLADPRPEATYDYRPASRGLLERALALGRICAGFGVPLRAAAARFPLSHPAVAGVLLGLRTPAEVRDAVAQFRRPLPDELWDALASSGLLGHVGNRRVTS
ncbi:aldo/keto reductase [Streptomyces sp. PU-14G]|uniref:aldo/keto reductase n=1 Tax=Streptomyces sp. PU-14G TaxID=2800808 RepID=UPI0034DF51EE